MIKEQFLYFARYPSKSGIRAILTNGSSDFPGYADLLSALDALPEQSRVPEINNYVYGQSFEELQQRISRLVGSFLFVDYGEFDMSGDKSHSFRLTQRMAVTVAFKMPERADAGEYMLASDTTLHLLSKVHAGLLADAEAGDVEWLSPSNFDNAELAPFVATELHSVGWTLMLSCTSPDGLGTHALYRSFVRRL